MRITHVTSCLPCQGTGETLTSRTILVTRVGPCPYCSGRGFIRTRVAHDSIIEAVEDLLSRPQATGIERGIRR